jgi:radical SAM protein with 4Fe4S-binding SPASM domain
LSIQDFKKIITELSKLGTEMYHLSGGELLLHPEIFSIIKLIKNNGYYLEATTNGILLDQQTLKKLKDLSIDKLVISFDGATARTHDFTRGEGNFMKSLRNLDLGLKMGLPMAVNYTVMKSNYEEIPKAIEIFGERKLEFLNFRRFIKTGSGVDIDEAITPMQYLKLFHIINKIREKDKRIALGGEPHRIVMNTRLREKALHFNEGGCSAGRYFISIDPNGDITPCGFIPIPIGNIHKDSIKEIWEKSSILNQLRDRDLLKGVCSNCPNKFICGGCRAAALGTYDNLLQEDPQCWRTLC